MMLCMNSKQLLALDMKHGAKATGFTPILIKKSRRVSFRGCHRICNVPAQYLYVVNEKGLIMDHRGGTMSSLKANSKSNAITWLCE